MAKISDLTPAQPLDGSERVPVLQGGETRGATIAQLRDGSAAPLQQQIDDLVAEIERLKAVQYTTPIPGVVLTTQPQLILPADPERVSATIQCMGGDVAFGIGDPTPAFDGAHFAIPAGSGFSDAVFGPEPVFAVSRLPAGAAGPINGKCAVAVTRKVKGAPPLRVGDRVVAYWPDPADYDGRAATRDLINALDAAGIYAKLGLLRLATASLANDAVNLADPAGLKAVAHGPLTHTPWYAVTNPDASWIDVQYSPAGLKQSFSSHSLYVWSDGDLIEGDGYAGGASHALAIMPRVTQKEVGFRSGTGRDNIVMPAGPVGLSRTNADEYMAFSGGTLIATQPRPITVIGNNRTFLLAVQASNVAVGFSHRPLRVFAAGAGLTASEMATLHAEIAKAVAVFDQIRAR